VETEASGELPNSFDGVEFRRVQGQVVEGKVKRVLFSPGLVQAAMMVFGVIGDHDYAATGSDAGAAKVLMKAKNVRPLNLPVSRRKKNFPSRSRTAPKYPTLCRVGACSRTGSLVSGGIHIWQREPCCWKCTSSVAHRSTVGSSISAWSFFYAPSAALHPLAQSGDAACAAESPVAGINAGIALPPNQSRTAGQSKLPRFCRPTDFPQPHIPGHPAKPAVDLFELLLIQPPGPA